MKKYIKVILVNLFIICIFFVAIDYSLYLKFRKAYSNGTYKTLIKMSPFSSYVENYIKPFGVCSIQAFKHITGYEFRIYNLNDKYTKPPILIFGCSFAYGHLLEDNQAINFKLSNLTQRNVFNFALCTCGIQHMLYIINQNFFGILDKHNKVSSLPPEYAIFVYIPSHLHRLQANIFPDIQSNGINLQYSINNNKLMLKDYPLNIFYKTFLLKSFYYMLDKKNESNLLKYKYNSFMLENEIFLESKRLLEEKFPGIKFIILNYQTENDETGFECDFMQDILEKEGFIFINSSDLIKRKFKFNSNDTVKDGLHPSSLSWDILLPPLVKKLNL